MGINRKSKVKGHKRLSGEEEVVFDAVVVFVREEGALSTQKAGGWLG